MNTSYPASLVPFETTATRKLAEDGAITLLNFATLFSRKVYLSDTVLGDHHLFAESFTSRNGTGGLYNHLQEMVRNGLLVALFRNKVMIRGTLLAEGSPTLEQIFQGWQRRDKLEHPDEDGFTTAGALTADTRLSYLETTDTLFRSLNAVQLYNPDFTKRAYREFVRHHSFTEGTVLARTINALPDDLKRQYFDLLNDEWFTYAEVWRLLKASKDDIAKARITRSPLSLHAHLNQFCLAQFSSADQSTIDPQAQLLALLNMKLKIGKPISEDITTTMTPPAKLGELLERADIRFNAADISLLGTLTVSDILVLREKGKEFLEFPDHLTSKSSLPVSRRIYPLELSESSLSELHWAELERLRQEFIKVFEKYLRYISNAIDRKTGKGPYRRSVLAAIIERNPTFKKVDQYYVPEALNFLLSHVLPGLPVPFNALSGFGKQAASQLFAFVFQEQSPARGALESLLPGRSWAMKDSALKI